MMNWNHGYSLLLVFGIKHYLQFNSAITDSKSSEKLSSISSIPEYLFFLLQIENNDIEILQLSYLIYPNKRC